MREVQASEAEAHFSTVLDAVEKGETIVISRDGEPVAHVIPVGASLLSELRSKSRQEATQRTLREIAKIRERSEPVTIEEVLAWRDEGRK